MSITGNNGTYIRGLSSTKVDGDEIIFSDEDGATFRLSTSTLDRLYEIYAYEITAREYEKAKLTLAIPSSLKDKISFDTNHIPMI